MPFTIAGYTMAATDVIRVRLREAGYSGVGEASGVYYRKSEDTAGMLAAIEQVREPIERGAGREDLLSLLHPGGARNALDCALWDLEAQLTGVPVWQRAGFGTFQRLVTTFTVAVDTPERMADNAASYVHARALKLKLDGADADSARLRAVRSVRPEVWIGIDANQSFTPAHLSALLPELEAQRVSVVEQPFPVGQEALLDSFECLIPIVADESVQGLDDFLAHADSYAAVNIKLDKCGGLTEGLAIARAARDRGKGVMVGNTIGSSLAMVPAMVLGQACDIVDLDGPVFLATDYRPSILYDAGQVAAPVAFWGACTTH